MTHSMADMDQEPADEVLVARCKTELPHNTRSYEQLVQRHMQRVFNIAYRVVANHEDAEDISQDVFLKVYNQLNGFAQHSSFSTWLYRIATNSALDALDKRRRRPGNSAPGPAQAREKQEQGSEQASIEARPEARAIQRELRECINRVFKKLEREQAEVLILRDIEDLSYDEISGMLGTGLSAVKMRIHRARLAFQQVYQQFCGQAQMAFTVTTRRYTSSKEKKGGHHEL